MKTAVVFFSLLVALHALEETTLREFKLGNNLLTSDIYKVLSKKEDGNFLLSPFSLQTVLALTLVGARGQSAQEIRTSLRLPQNEVEIFADFLPRLKSDKYTLLSANKVYVKQNFSIHDEFKKIATEKYQADFDNINFDKKEEAVKQINQWVEAQTRDKIRDIVSTDDINERSRLILINALYFKGNWSIPFHKLYTKAENFYPKEKEAVSVDTMHMTDDFNYYKCTELDAQFLQMFFKDGDVSMVVVLPNDRKGIDKLESKIEKVFTGRNFTKELVEVSLPKFKIETTIDFVDILKKLEMRAVFDGPQADLSGIAGEPGDLEIGKIVQKAFVDVEESGAEAAAATVVNVDVPDSEFQPDVRTPKVFKADHPFIFYIKVQDVVLFGGRVSIPKKQ